MAGSLHRVLPARLVPNARPCALSQWTRQGIALSGSTVAWIPQPIAGPYRLHFADLSADCEILAIVPFGEAGLGAPSVGLIDPDHALVVDGWTRGWPSVRILSRSPGASVGPVLSELDVGTRGPRFIEFVAGTSRVAALVSGDKPVFIGF
jgi:hypothetical protein